MYGSTGVSPPAALVFRRWLNDRERRAGVLAVVRETSMAVVEGAVFREWPFIRETGWAD
jgi:hypothetical protein